MGLICGAVKPWPSIFIGAIGGPLNGIPGIGPGRPIIPLGGIGGCIGWPG